MFTIFNVIPHKNDTNLDGWKVDKLGEKVQAESDGYASTGVEMLISRVYSMDLSIHMKTLLLLFILLMLELRLLENLQDSHAHSILPI